ncbi:MAG: extracellular solute-binding protein [Candidatus Nanogingivalis sp.]
MGTKRSRLLMGVSAITTALLFAACGGGGTPGGGGGGVVDDKPDKGLPVVGENVTYDPNTLVGEGKPISLDWWAWANVEKFQAIADAYEEIHPNVTINVVNQPWEDYWTKLPLELQGKSGPTLFNVHNSQHENLINFMEPYDIPTADLEADFVGAGSHVIDGKVHYIDFGLMTGAIYYNTDMWAAAGLTDADIPETWDEFREVAKKLTVRDGDKLTQAGFNMNDASHNLQLGLPYQQGQNLFAADQTTPTVDTAAGLKTMQTLLDIYADGSGDPNFGPKYDESFGQGLSAMVYAWGHFTGHLQANYPDLKWGTFRTPIFDAGETPYAYDRYNGEATFGINSGASAEQKAVAQDFLRYFLTDGESQKELTLTYGVYPAYRPIADDPAFADAPAQAAIADIERYIWPGPMPATFESSLQKAWQDVLYNGVDPQAALTSAQAAIEQDLEGKGFVAVENLYAFYKAS